MSKIIWITGLSGSGKTTLAYGLKKKLEGSKSNIVIIDGDEYRKAFSYNQELDFTLIARKRNVERIAKLAFYLAKMGVTVIVSCCSPCGQQRAEIKKEAIQDSIKFTEVFANCPFYVCAERDTKDLYKKAINKEIDNFIGLDIPYSQTQKPDIMINTELMSKDEALNALWGGFENVF